MKEQKIFLKKEDNLQTAVKKLVKSRADKVILNIPRDSVLSSSADNFHTLKRESIMADKDLVIESSDLSVQEFADAAKIDVVNPVFGRRKKLISDIIPKSKKAEIISPTLNFRKDIADYKADNEFLSGYAKKEQSPRASMKWANSRKKRRLNIVKHRVSFAVVIMALLVGSFASFNILPRATVVVTLKRTLISFEESVKAATNIYEEDFSINGPIFIPGELISAKKNLEMRFAATGEEKIEKKATGKIFIYNELSSMPQVLVQRTRFITPDGKIYRLTKRVIVPGAKVTGGEVSPSSIEVEVIADKAGQKYNINPNSEEIWRIPGFKEAGLDDRYRGFYGKPSGPFAGGFSGIAKVPTEEDIEKGRNVMVSVLTDTLGRQMIIMERPEFTLLNEASDFEITTENIEETADERGEFGIFSEARARRLVFEESSLQNILVDKLVPQLDFEFKIVESELVYKDVEINWLDGRMNFIVEGKMVLETSISKDVLRAQLLGREELVIRSVIFNIPGLEKAKVSLWPFWVKSVPKNPEKIKITFE